MGKLGNLLPEDLGIPKFLMGKFKPRQFLQREGEILAPSERKKENLYSGWHSMGGGLPSGRDDEWAFHTLLLVGSRWCRELSR